LSALLEVLDPEQKTTPSPIHYIEVEYDLSEVMFVATGQHAQHPAGRFLDRMEVIRLSGYTEDEKVNIAIRYLLPKQLKADRPAGERDLGLGSRDPRHRALLHARSRRARARARGFQRSAARRSSSSSPTRSQTRRRTASP